MINSTGYAARVTQENLTGENIIIDTLPPTLTLNGNNNSISALGKPYTELNATAYDLSYGSKNIAPTIAGTVNIFSIANHTVSYSAPSDLAGNAGPTITRIVRVLNLPSLEILDGFSTTPAGTYGITSPDHVATFQIGTATYAGISSNAGLTIVNITEIGSPTYVSRYNGKPVSGTSNTLQPSFTAFVSIDGSTYALSDHGRYLVILKANNLVSFSRIAVIEDGQNGFTALDGITSITTTTIGSSTYALVTAANDNGVQIINITTPGSPIVASAVTTGSNYPNMLGPISITTTTIGSSTYALVASSNGHRVHIIDITTPDTPTSTSILLDNTNSLKLKYPRSVTTTTIDSSTYALVASQTQHAVSIINITTPSDPDKASVVSDGSKYSNLNTPFSVTTTTIGSSTYALVAAKGDNGVQVIDITNPYVPINASSPKNGSNGFTKLSDPRSITTIADLPEYALAASHGDNGIQIIKVNTDSVFESNNQNPAYAKAGDTLRVAFAVNDVFTSDATKFTTPNQDPSVLAAGATYDAMLTISSDPIEANAEFTIALGHDQKATLTVTEDTFNQSVFVDTIRPEIELVGSANYTVFIESNDPFIPGAIATDGDPNYSQNYTMTPNGDLDTNRLSTFVYTYTADDDAAGNPGMSVNRIVSVVDFDQITIKSLTLTDNNHASSDYVKAGDTVTLTLITDGSDVGNATGHIFGDTNLVSSISNNRITFTKTVYENDTNGLATFEIFVRNSSGYAGVVTRASLTSGDVSVDTIPPTITLNGENNTIVVLDRAYTGENATAFDISYGYQNVTPTGNVNVNAENNYTLTYTAPDDPAGNDGPSITRNVRVIDFPPLSIVEDYAVSPVGTWVHSASINDPDHVSTFKIGTATYAGVSSAKGLTIINITDIGSPTPVSRYSGTPISGQGALSPSFTTFVSIDGSTYALSEHGNNIVILKADNNVSFAPVASASDGQDSFTELEGVSFIATTTVGSSTYALVAAKADDGVQIIDITTPDNPRAVSDITDGVDNFTELDGANSIAITTIGSSTYALVASIFDDGVQIIDITTPSSPTAVSNVTDGLDGYTTLDYARSITTATINSSTYALVVSSLDHGVQIINITDPYKPTPASNVINDLDGFTTLTSPNYITTITTGSLTYALVTAFADDGVQIINITDPYKPTPASSIIDGSDGFTTLAGVRSITTITDSSTYVLVTAKTDDGIQIMRINLPPALVSNNPNPVYAKAGDTLTLEFAINDTIVSSTTHFTNPDQIPSMTIYNATYIATYIATLTVPSDPIEAYADFKVTLENNHTIKLSVTENDLSSNVFIDTIPPTIDLVGDSDHTVYVGIQDPSIPGAIASDGSLGYSASYSMSETGNLNTSNIGSTVNYTYTAHADAAGNPGASITRTVTVIDYNPLDVTSLTVSSTNSVNSNYAKAGDEITINLKHYGLLDDAIGNILENKNFTVDKYYGATDLTKTITQNDTNGNLTFDILVTNSSGYAARVTQEDLSNNNIIIDTVQPIIHLYGINNTISGLGLPYVDLGAFSSDLSYGIQNVTGTGAVNTSKIGSYNILYDASDFAGNPANITRTVHVQQLAPISLTNESSQFLVSPTTTVNDSADYPYLGDSYRVTTIKINDFTYALITAYKDDGFTILDITTPDAPTLVFNATKNTRINAGIDGPTGISTIQIQNSIYAIITSVDTSSITILDITNPVLPIVKSTTTRSDNANIAAPFAVSTVDIDGSAYALVVSKANSRIVIFNITDPMNLTQVSVLQDGADYTLGGITHVTPIKMDNSTYILTAARSSNSVGIIDIGNPKMPEQVALLEDDINLALKSANSIEIISINGRTYALVASPGDNAMQIIDVTHPASPFPVSAARHGAEYPALLKPHDVTAIKVENSTYALLSAINDNSIQIIDITNPQSPHPASHINQGTEYTNLEKPQTLKAVQINGAAYALIASRTSNGIQIIQLEHEKTIQSPFSITSNGANSLYAKAGDTVSVQITINDTIYSHTTQILNLTTHTAVDPNTINASAVIQPINVEGYANFTISLENYLGVTLNLTENDLTTQNVFVDTISPKITLNGNADYTVFVNSSYAEPGAVASDGDPNYTHNYTITNSSSLNTTMVGSFVVYTYTADPDGAGNPGASISRTVTVVDYDPLNVTSLTASSNSENIYAKAGDKITIIFETDGPVENVLGDILGNDNFKENILSGSSAGSFGGTIILTKTITQSDTNGNLTFDIFLTNSIGYAARVTQEDLVNNHIIIDTIPPTITLNGKNNTISILNSTYTDANATAYDLSYGEESILPTGTVNVNVIGNYSLSYTALPDLAGNTGPIITRNVIVRDTPPIDITTLTIATENSTLYAKAGDTVYLTLEVNDTISTHNTQILNAAISRQQISGNSLHLQTIVSSNATESNAEFTITVTNINGTTLTVTEDDLTSSNVFIDTVSPRIQLVGPAEYFVINGTENSIIPGVNVTDGDPNYSGDYTLTTPDGKVNANINGSVYNYTYTAGNDTAGNLGENVTRTVTVTHTYS